ncbi:hypothetical protein LAJ19_15220 (plasmid) [Deinococcus taeanensis]|uniref:hypothetical protein n=1 Tax=Deinococcus taeanensis TaxID=2737050 RepID=UPI001CDBC0ED|nr:hypothetical protein [Deinococcus taeanensis]UBV44154.1 hypothetical protein LAJ19_15220 [Deinococcus taeanensis]
MKRTLMLSTILMTCAIATAQTPPSPPPAATAAPAATSYTFEILDANRQPIATFDATGRLRITGTLSTGTLLRLSRTGASRLFQLAQPVTESTTLGEVVLVYGSSTVTLGALLNGTSNTAENSRPSVTPQQLNALLGLSTSLGSVSVGMATSLSLNGIALTLPLILPLF